MALQLAENPQTGERIAFINGRWVPFTEMAQNPQTGERAVKVDGLWYTGAGQAPQQPAAPTPPQEESGFLRQAADVPVQIASGVATGVRMITDAFGANNPVSQNIRGVEDYLQGLLSAQAKSDQQEIARLMQEAEDKGIGAQLTAALQALGTAPVDLIANALGTTAPTLVGGLAAQALKFSARAASTGIGAVMGAGVTKGSIYDEVKQTLTDLGVSPEDAERRARLAQEYGGENLDQILVGAVFGGIAGRVGIEPNVAKALAGEITRKSVLKAGLQEAGPEAAQAFQEQVAQNVALQRESVREPEIGEVPTFRGAVGAGALEGLVGAGVGGIGEVAARRVRPEVPPEAPPGETTEETTEPPPQAPVTTDAERAKLLADIEEIDTTDEAAQTKFDETVAKIKAAPEGDLGVALNVARSKVQESGKTSAPYILNAVNKYKPEGLPNITLSEASQIRRLLVEEGIIEAKGQVKKAEPVVTAPTDDQVETVVDYEDLERQQIEAATRGIETGGEDVSTADVPTAQKAKPTGTGERAGAPVSGKPPTNTQIDTAAEGQVSTETVEGRVGSDSDSLARSVRREKRVTTPLNTESIETPYDRHESLQRRLEGLVTARRIQPTVAGRIREVLKQGSPVTNPETYQSPLDQAEKFIDQYEKYAEDVESGDTNEVINRRESRLKQQERAALERAQRQIAQNKIAEALKDRRASEDYEEENIPRYAQKVRDILDRGAVKPVTQILASVDAAAVEAYPGVQNLKFRQLFKTVAEKINSVDFSNVSVQTEATVGADIARFERLKSELKYAEYDPSNNTIYFRRSKINPNTILHELVHAGTVQVIRRYELDGLAQDTKQAKEQLELAQKVEGKDAREKAVEKATKRVEEVERQKLGVQRLMNVYELTQSQTSDPSLIREFPAAFENLYEFLAIGMTSPIFQNRLARLEVPLVYGRKNLWTEFVKAVGNLFGFNIKSKDGVSALDELGQAFSEIVSAPSKEGITGVKPLAAKKAEKEPKAIDPVEEAKKKREAILGSKLTLKGLFKDRLSVKNASKVVTQLQDRQRYIYELQRDMDRAEVAIWMPPSQSGNTLAAANDEATGKYENYEKVVMPLANDLNTAIRAFAAKLGKSVDDASNLVDAYLTSKANLKRRVINYWKEKPLKATPTIRLKGSDQRISYAQYRDMLIDSLLTDQELDDGTREAIYDRLMQLVGLEIGPDGKPRRTKDAAKYEDPLGVSYAQEQKNIKPGKREVDFFHPYYDNIKDYGYKTDEQMVDKVESDPVANGPELKAVRNALRKLDEATQRFNEEANHLTQPAKNLIKLYGWGDDYVPLMGKVRSESAKRDQFIYMNTVPNEMIRAFGGRSDAPDSPILMTIINAGKAATRAAKKDIVPTLVNLMRPHPKTGKQYVKGERVGTITFKDRYKGDINFEEKDGKGGTKWVGQDKFYNYLPNGDIDVWRVDDPDIVQALRPDWEPDKTVFPRLQSVSQFLTSVIGQGHTRYQVKFAPYDFPRNVFANAGITMAELNPLGGLLYMSNVGIEVLKGRLPQMWKLSKYHNANDWKAIQRMGGYDAKTKKWKDPFIRDAYRYLERGGKISIIRTWQNKERLEELVELANKSITRQKFSEMIDALNWFFDRWLDMFEFTARVQAYKTAKSYAENVRKLEGEAAELFAVNYTKNLANFEKRGLMRWPGALYAFWGPAATGAVRAMDAIAPALRLTTPQVLGGTTIQKVLDELPEEIRTDPKAIENYAKNYSKQRINGLFAMAYFTSVGYMGYEIARSLGALVKDVFDEDEEPTNPVTTDSKELWTRNLRIPLDWLDIPQFKGKYLQIPWGFGLGAFGAAGAQIAALRHKDQSITDFAGNMTTIAIDSYLPLPVARYNPFHGESLFVWATTSLAPTIVRPLYEYTLNMSGLGHRIYRSYYNKYGPAYTGSENIEEIYRDLALLVRDVTLGEKEPEPNEIRYLTTAYFDGVAAILADSYNLYLNMNGTKDFDVKTDLIALDNFIGNKTRPAIAEFQKADRELAKFKRRYDSFINDPRPEKAEEFRTRFPEADSIVALYNMHITRMNQYRRISSYDEVHADGPRERKRIAEEHKRNKDVMMNQVSALYETFKDQIN